jgi:hypothetical protein
LRTSSFTLAAPCHNATTGGGAPACARMCQCRFRALQAF